MKCTSRILSIPAPAGLIERIKWELHQLPLEWQIEENTCACKAPTHKNNHFVNRKQQWRKNDVQAANEFIKFYWRIIIEEESKLRRKISHIQKLNFIAIEAQKHLAPQVAAIVIATPMAQEPGRYTLTKKHPQ